MQRAVARPRRAVEVPVDGEGERRGWEQVVRRYGAAVERRVQTLVWRLGLPPAADRVEDLMQEFYCRLFAGGAERLALCLARSDGETFAYLGRIAERVVFDVLRAGTAAKRSPGRGMEVPWEAMVVERALGAAASPLERLLGGERLRLLLARCGRHAGRDDRRRNCRILRLALLGGFSSAEIARELGGGLAPSSIDSLVHRVKRRLEREGIVLAVRGGTHPPPPRRVPAERRR
ncbi:MAG TPA: hypothetical protein VGE98_15790 [Thermoanaerobaculia bacterium]